MKILKSLCKVCLIAGFILSSQLSFATDILIRKDNTPPPTPVQPHALTVNLYPVTAEINSTNLTVSFETTVGSATVAVYDATDQLITYQTVDTGTTAVVNLSLNGQNAGDYVVRISYGTTHLIGDFQIE